MANRGWLGYAVPHVALLGETAMTRAKALVLLGIIFALIIAACDDSGDTAQAGDKPPIKIGLITDLSGRFVSFGRDIDAATQLAVEQINANGGVNGSELVIVTSDTAGEPDQAVVGFRTLVNDGVVAVSGPISSGEAEVLFAQAPDLMVPIMTGTANKEGITAVGDGWAFRNTATNTALYAEGMPAWAEEYGIRTAVLVFDEEEPVTAAAARFAIPPVAEAEGIEIVNLDSPVTFARGQTNFATAVQRIREQEADGLIIMSGPAEAGLLARELSRQGEVREILGHPAQASDTFFAQGGDDINHWVLPSILDPEPGDEATRAFLAAMEEVGDDEPVPEAANYFDNIQLFASVMRDAGIDGNTSLDEARRLLREGLLSVSGFQGVAGTISFDESGDAMKTVYVNVVIAGDLQPLG